MAIGVLTGSTPDVTIGGAILPPTYINQNNLIPIERFPFK